MESKILRNFFEEHHRHWRATPQKNFHPFSKAFSLHSDYDEWLKRHDENEKYSIHSGSNKK